jgi:DNA-binding NarL/FixJ family response regulator
MQAGGRGRGDNVSERRLSRIGEPESTARQGRPVPARTVVLRSPHLGWLGLDTALGQMGGFRIVADGLDTAQALRAVGRFLPELAIVTGEPDGIPAAALVREVRTRSAVSKVVVLGEAADRELVQASWAQGMRAISCGASSPGAAWLRHLPR